jgi:hypothetical protein
VIPNEPKTNPSCQRNYRHFTATQNVHRNSREVFIILNIMVIRNYRHSLVAKRSLGIVLCAVACIFASKRPSTRRINKSHGAAILEGKKIKGNYYNYDSFCVNVGCGVHNEKTMLLRYLVIRLVNSYILISKCSQ